MISVQKFKTFLCKYFRLGWKLKSINDWITFRHKFSWIVHLKVIESVIYLFMGFNVQNGKSWLTEFTAEMTKGDHKMHLTSIERWEGLGYVHRLLLECSTTTFLCSRISVIDCSTELHMSQKRITKRDSETIRRLSEWKKFPVNAVNALSVVIHPTRIPFHRQSVFSAACENCSGVSCSMLLSLSLRLVESWCAYFRCDNPISSVSRDFITNNLPPETMRNNLVVVVVAAEKIISQDCLLNQRTRRF